MSDSTSTHRSIQRPQFNLRSLLGCIAVIAGVIASVTQLGVYSIGVMPMCATFLLAFTTGGTWKDGLLLTLFVYGCALTAIVLLTLLMLLAYGISYLFT